VLVIVTMSTLAYIFLWEGLSMSSYSFECNIGEEMSVLLSSCAVSLEGEVVWSKYTTQVVERGIEILVDNRQVWGDIFV